MSYLKRLLLTICSICAFLILPAAPGAAQDNYNIQYFRTNSAANFTFFLQGISGFAISGYSDRMGLGVDFNNVTITGLYNISYGVGSFRNQGSLAFVNIQPTEIVPPATFVGTMFSVGNRARITEYDYSINLNFNAFRGSGIMVFNLMAGSFSNQFTSLAFTMGRNVIAPPSPTNAVILTGNPAVVALSNQQMAAVAAAQENNFQVTGRQSAVATIKGAPDIQGVGAITLSAGLNNQVLHRVEVNINTGN